MSKFKPVLKRGIFYKGYILPRHNYRYLPPVHAVRYQSACLRPLLLGKFRTPSTSSSFLTSSLQPRPGALNDQLSALCQERTQLYIYIKLQTALTTYFLFSLLLLVRGIKFNNINLLLVSFSW